MSNLADFAMFRFNFWPKPFYAPPPGSAGMDNSYVPNPLTSPALMVLTSSPEGHEGARLPAPHHYQSQGLDKEMPSPFTSTPFTMYRPGDHFHAPLYTPVPPFARGGLEPRLSILSPGGGGAFRPLGQSHEGLDSYQSAFSPAKKAKLEETNSHFYNNGAEDKGVCDLSAEHGGSKDGLLHVKDERPSSISSAGGDTMSENLSESGDQDRGTPDSEGRNLRRQRKRVVLDGQTPCCPLCGLTLRPGEAEQHLGLELEKLDKISRGGRKSRDSTPLGRKSLSSPLSGRRGRDSPSPEASALARQEAFQRIRCNRQSRLNARLRLKKKKPAEEVCKETQTQCPICSEKLVGTSEELNGHVEMCLKKNKGNVEDETVDVEGDSETFEEYEWAGQTRVRASSLLEGGFSGSGFQTTSSRKVVEEEGDLNVDGDDSEMYGPSQFTENDVIPLSADEPTENRERLALRGAVLSSSSAVTSTSSHEGDEQLESKPVKLEPDSCQSSDRPDAGKEDYSQLPPDQIVSMMKARLQEDDEKHSKQKCLICMGAYQNPLVSIQCWHVHCQECWLRTLGAKKLCPQCNMITSPGNLRRIFF